MPDKSEKGGECANAHCNTAGAQSYDMEFYPLVYYCQDCAKHGNDERVRNNKPPIYSVRPNG